MMIVSAFSCHGNNRSLLTQGGSARQRSGRWPWTRKNPRSPTRLKVIRPSDDLQPQPTKTCVSKEKENYMRKHPVWQMLAIYSQFLHVDVELLEALKGIRGAEQHGGMRTAKTTQARGGPGGAEGNRSWTHTPLPNTFWKSRNNPEVPKRGGSHRKQLHRILSGTSLIGVKSCQSQSQKTTPNQRATKVNMSINGPQGRDYRRPTAYEMQIPLFKMLPTPLSCVISAMSAHSNYLGKCTN